MREICRCERRVSQFSTSSPANSLPVQETLLQQNKSTLGPEKTDFKFFEIFLLPELVGTYDKLNINAKKKIRIIGTLMG